MIDNSTDPCVSDMSRHTDIRVSPAFKGDTRIDARRVGNQDAITRAVADPRPWPRRFNRDGQATRCQTCRAVVIAVLCADDESTPGVLAPAGPLTVRGEAYALMAGRGTWRFHGIALLRFTLRHAWDIESAPAHRAAVYATHECDKPTPAEWMKP